MGLVELGVGLSASPIRTVYIYTDWDKQERS